MTSPILGAQELALTERVLPPHAPGMRIGLFGGTFDPPHQAHFDASLLAMKRLKLDRVWWLVTPGNPLKNTSHLAPLNQRLADARRLTNHRRLDVTGLEAVIKTRYTYDTILWLLARCPRVQFVWIMGADNLRHFHRWQKWRDIADLIPMVVVDRPGPSLYASASPAGQALARFRISENAAASLPGRHAPAWTFLHGLKSSLSSTALRALRKTPEPSPDHALKPVAGEKPAAEKSNIACEFAASVARSSQRSASNSAKAKSPKTIKAAKKSPPSKKLARTTRSTTAAKPASKAKASPRKAGGKSAK